MGAPESVKLRAVACSAGPLCPYSAALSATRELSRSDAGSTLRSVVRASAPLKRW
jgi:hypothetical protein